jgi:hypothetical protein
VTRVVGTVVDRVPNVPGAAPDPGCELDGSCLADGVADVGTDGVALVEEIERRALPADASAYTVAARVDWAPRPEHQGSLVLWGYREDVRRVGVNGTPGATQIDSEREDLDVVLDWASAFDEGRTRVTLVAGWHGERQRDRALAGYDDTMHTEALFTNLGAVGRNAYTPESDAVLRFCTDGDPLVPDAFPTITNCPAASYEWGGPGLLDDERQQRLTSRAEVVQRIDAGPGTHDVRAGLELTWERLHDGARATGGRTASGTGDLWTLYDPAVRVAGDAPVCAYDENLDPVRCEAVPAVDVGVDGWRWRGWLGDTWTALPGLTVAAGAHVAGQMLHTSDRARAAIDPLTARPYGETGLDLTGWAPSLDVRWDPTGEGRVLLFGRARREHHALPLGLARRAFGGNAYAFADAPAGACGGAPTGPDDAHTPRLDSVAEGCPGLGELDLGVIDGSWVSVVEETPQLVAPGTRPGHDDELALGASAEIAPGTVVGVAYQGRRLGRAVEDVGFDTSFVYTLANPGEDVDSSALEAQRDTLPAGDPKRAVLDGRIDALSRIGALERPTRRWDAVHLSFHHRFAGGRPWMLAATYTWSRLTGNYPGFLQESNGQVDAGLSSQWDHPDNLANREGPLPGDRTHRVVALAHTSFDLGPKAGAVTTGVQVRGATGAPVDVLGRSAFFGAREVFILPRGAGGRTASMVQVDLRLAWSRPLPQVGAGGRVSVTFDLYNVFDAQTETAVDAAYTNDRVAPIVGGDARDLRYLKRLSGGSFETGALARKNPGYGLPTAREAPIAMRIGLRMDF